MDKVSRFFGMILKVAFLGAFGAAGGALIFTYPIMMFVDDENSTKAAIYAAIFGATYAGYAVGKTEGKEEGEEDYKRKTLGDRSF